MRNLRSTYGVFSSPSPIIQAARLSRFNGRPSSSLAFLKKGKETIEEHQETAVQAPDRTQVLQYKLKILQCPTWILAMQRSWTLVSIRMNHLMMGNYHVRFGFLNRVSTNSTLHV